MADDQARVEVRGRQADAQRREDTVARVSVGREELARFGDPTLAGSLGRLPGVTMVAGEVRMRGLGDGYTQVLLNGQPVPPGFNLDSVPSDLVERVEILRGATAETGGRAIAGTINIVLRKRAGSARGEWKAAVAQESGHVQAQATLVRGERSADRNWLLALVAAHSGANARARTIETVPLGERSQASWFRSRQNRLSAAPRVEWTGEGGATTEWESWLDLARLRNHGAADESVLAGAGSDFPDSRWRIASRLSSMRTEINSTRRMGAARISAKFGATRDRRDSDYLFEGHGADTLNRAVASNAIDTTWSATGKLRYPVAEGHSAALGWDLAWNRRSELRLQSDSNAAGAPLGVLDADYVARVRRQAWYLQDEWTVVPQADLYLGLRHEGLQARTEGATLPAVRNDAASWSPMAQLLWRLGGKDQLRLALARTYKPPQPSDLVPRRYTQNNDNSPLLPHFQGNPALRPELSRNLDLAWETYDAHGGMASVSAYARRIDGVMLQNLSEDGGGWVATPANGGLARLYGIELEWRRSFGRLDLRANGARNWSRVDGLPAPDNRLARQTPYSANIGADYRWSDAVQGGAAYSVQGGGWSRTNPLVRDYAGVARSFDLYLNLRLGQGRSLKFAGSNLLRQDQLREVRYGAWSRYERSERAAALRITLEQAM
ncbi:MAG TPA: TonB-dependent receptor [Telluria sp.]|nr:TonB-dependent receptor [Telluria sp.]